MTPTPSDEDRAFARALFTDPDQTTPTAVTADTEHTADRAFIDALFAQDSEENH